jgi:hypothetical protein
MGFMAGYAAKANKARFMTILADTATRGSHAWGVAWLDPKGRLRMYKENGDVGQCLERAWRIVKDARMFIFHTRWATHGAKDGLNNHPHSIDGGWLIHNGVVGNYRQLCQRDDIGLISQCDSEVICRLAEVSTGRLPDRMKDAIDQTTGNLAIAAIWHKPETLVIAKRGNPLSVGRDDCGLWFSSNGVGLETFQKVRDDRLLEYRYKVGLPMVYRKRDLQPYLRPLYSPSVRFDPSGVEITETTGASCQTDMFDRPRQLTGQNNYVPGMVKGKRKKNRNKYQHRQPNSQPYTSTVIRPNRVASDEDKSMTMDEWLERQRERDAIVAEKSLNFQNRKNRPAQELTYEPLPTEEVVF